MKRNCRFFILSLGLSFLVACQSVPVSDSGLQQQELDRASRANVDKLYIVDCLLPSQVRKLGGQLTYLSVRRPIRTSAINCEIRGGEYTAYDRADYRTALKIWLASAKQGNADAQVNVGEIYEKGLGIVPDYELARLWYEKAAKQGNPRAEINLGYLYEKGLGVKRDLVKAINWYRRASGLVTDDLKFASSIEVEVAVSTNREVVKLKQQINESQREVALLKKQLNSKTRNLAHKQQQLHAAFARLSHLQKKMTRYSAKRSQEEAVKLTTLNHEISQLKLDIGQQQELIGKLQTDLKQHKSRLNEKVILASASVSERLKRTPGPSINILDQALVLTRGLPTLKLPVYREHYNIMGRVTAPAGLLGFTVNGRMQKIDKSGKFKARLTAGEGRTKVKMVAVDKGARVARLLFAIEPVSDIRPQLPGHVARGAISREDVGDIQFGDYHALVIGNNQYRHFPQLKTAVNDAKRAEAILRKRYGFKTKLLLNADRYQILSALNEMRVKLGKSDNLLIYYAGHGEIDGANQRGYWLPVDAEQNNTANWISNLDITDILNVINAKHIMVVADSCYSGTMSSTAQTRMSLGVGDSQKKSKWIKVMSRTRARVVMTSGGVKPVLDAGSGRHSVFAGAFLDALERNNSVIEGYRLYQQISQTVQNNAAQYSIEQKPRYAPMRHGGGLGEFFFVPKS